MANEITFGWKIGSTLTYGVYQPDGTVRTAAATALGEIAGTGYYVATNGDIVAGDFVIVKEGTMVVGEGQYQPEVVSSSIDADLTNIEAKIDIIDTNVDDLIVDQNKVLNVVDETIKAPAYQVIIE